MKRLFTLICFISLLHVSVAQNFSAVFGTCNEEELKLQKYDKDPVAEAMVIYDSGSSHFGTTGDGLALIFERKMKIKIFNKKLYIQTSVGPLKNELQYQKPQIIARINEAFGEEVITEVIIS